MLLLELNAKIANSYYNIKANKNYKTNFMFNYEHNVHSPLFFVYYPSPLTLYKSHSLHKAPILDFIQLLSPGIQPPLQYDDSQNSIIWESNLYLQ